MITMENMLEFLADLLDLEPEELSPEQGPEDVEGWDSVNALRILVHLESEYGVRLTMDQFVNAKTIQQLFDLVNKG